MRKNYYFRRIRNYLICPRQNSRGQLFSTATTSEVSFRNSKYRISRSKATVPFQSSFVRLHFIIMDPSEIEFLAEETVVTVVPNFNCRKTYLITGELGPFRAGIPLKVPLWLAADLKRRQKCRIVPPEWMDLEKLEKLRDEEAESPRFCRMPSEYYIVEAKIILELGIEDNPSLIPIMSVIKEIWDRRMTKLATSVNVFMHLGGNFVRIPNMTPAELNIIRPILPNAMDFLKRLGGKERVMESGESVEEAGGTLGDAEMNFVLNCRDYFSPSGTTSS